MERGRRIPELDGLRAGMIFLVSWYHIWQQSWWTPAIAAGGFHYSLDWLVRAGYVWVDGTVLLSAFLLYLPIARKGRDTRLDPVDFYYKKARRILPGFYIIVLLVFLGICLPWDLYYGNGPYIVKDLATHFSLTFNFFYDTYVATPLGAASWTLAVIGQAYALFPLAALGMRKHPAATLIGMALVCFGFRAWCLWGLADYTMVVNQLINFLDVYVIGFLAATAFARIEKAEPEKNRTRKARILSRAIATAVFFGCLYGICQLLKVQAASQGYPALQGNQMKFRPLFALGFAGLVLSAPFSFKALRFLLGNRVTKFLAAISMNYYLTHQTIIVHMKRIRFPASVSDTPNMAGEMPWQMQYTWLAFGISFAAAVIMTYAVEKPAGKLLDKIRDKRKAKLNAGA